MRNEKKTEEFFALLNKHQRVPELILTLKSQARSPLSTTPYLRAIGSCLDTQTLKQTQLGRRTRDTAQMRAAIEVLLRR